MISVTKRHGLGVESMLNLHWEEYSFFIGFTISVRFLKKKDAIVNHGHNRWLIRILHLNEVVVLLYS